LPSQIPSMSGAEVTCSWAETIKNKLPIIIKVKQIKMLNKIL